MNEHLDLTAIYDTLIAGLKESTGKFNWEESRIIRGSLTSLPEPEVFKSFPAGTWFAIVDIPAIHPRQGGDLLQTSWDYAIALIHKGRFGNISREREEAINAFLDGWYRYWAQRQVIHEITDVIPAAGDLESIYDGIMAIVVSGTVQNAAGVPGYIHE